MKISVGNFLFCFSGMTFAHEAFPIVNEKMFSTKYGMRGGNVKKILIVLSDGRENVWGNSQQVVDNALDEIKAKGKRNL